MGSRRSKSWKTEMQQNAQPRLISIVRRSGELFALISELDPKAEESKTFEIKCIPLDRVKPSVYPAKERLQESWRFLAKMTTAEEDTLYHVLVAAIESVPDLSIPASPPALPLDWGTRHLRAKATSAHPRAFRGTKYQPPKGSGLTSIACLPPPSSS